MITGKRSIRPNVGSRRLQPKQVSELVVMDRESGAVEVVYETQELIEAPNWTPDGKWLIYNGDGRLFRISVDGAVGPCRINTVPVENVNNDHVIAPDGRQLIVTSSDGHLYVVPIEGGTPVRISNVSESEDDYRCYLHGISPDGETVVYVGLERKRNGRTVTRICTIPTVGGPETILTDGAFLVDGPEYSPDGQWIYFNSEAAGVVPGHAQVFRMRPDGSGHEQLTHDERVNWFPHAAPDGTVISFISFPQGTLGHPADRDVILRTMLPDGADQHDLDHFNGGQGTINVNSWAPDSKRLAYVRYPLST